MKSSILFIFFALLLTLNADELLVRTQVMMGTYVSISLPKEKMSLSTLAFERLKTVEKALSSYDPLADIYRLNHQRRTSISEDSYEALSLSARYYQQTQGYFDITVGSITKALFHFGEEESLPLQEDMDKAVLNFQGLHYNRHDAWLDKGVLIDLGGMGKGFGVDKAAQLLKKRGVKSGVIALSGDIRCLHRCRMAIQHPFMEGELATFTMANENTGISTSGNYRRYVNTTDYNHLINPKRHESQKTFASITLVSNTLSNSDLDAYATAASVMPREKALHFLDALPQIAYLIVTNDKRVFMNRHFKTLTQGLKLYELSNMRKEAYIKAPSLRFQSSKKRLFSAKQRVQNRR